MNTDSKGLWKGSIRVFKDYKAIVITGMLLALHLVLSIFVTLPLTDTVRISVAFITNVVTGYLYGPWMAMLTGALGDILQLILKPTGAWFFGWTLNAALGGMLYGMFFYRKAPREMEVAKVASDDRAKAGKKALVQLLPAVCSAILLVVWFTVPFLTVTTKATTEQPEAMVLMKGSAFRHLVAFIKGNGSESTGVVAGAIFVFLVLIFVFSLCRKKVPVMLLSIMALLWQLLPVYTDRKVMQAETGFIILAAGFAVCLLAMLFSVLWQHSVDGAYLLRCFLVMAVTAVFIQMFLGTLWCSIMYGKGFWFYFVPRAIKSLIQLPFNTVLAYYVIAAVKRFKLGQN